MGFLRALFCCVTGADTSAFYRCCLPDTPVNLRGGTSPPMSHELRHEGNGSRNKKTAAVGSYSVIVYRSRSDTVGSSVCTGRLLARLSRSITERTWYDVVGLYFDDSAIR